MLLWNITSAFFLKTGNPFDFSGLLDANIFLKNSKLKYKVKLLT